MIPQVARLGNHQLFAVFSSVAKGSGSANVYGAFSADGGRTWSNPRMLMKAPEKKAMADPNLLVDGNRVSVFCTMVGAPNRIERSSTMQIRSEDNGASWSEMSEIAIPRQYVSGKQHNAIVLRDGSYLMGIAWDKWPEMGMTARTEGEMDLTTGVLLSKDGVHWSLHGALHTQVDKLTPGGTNGLCEPSFVELTSGEVLMIMRSGATHHYESRSRDGGLTWSEPVPSALPGHNTPTALLRLEENPGEIVALWNNSPLARYPLSAAISSDGGKTWTTPRIVVQTNGLQVSYPGLAQTREGSIVAVWQQALPDGGRDIRWARFSRDWILTGK